MTPRTTLILVAIAGAAATAGLFVHRRGVAAEVAMLEAARNVANDGTTVAQLAAEVDRIRLALEGSRAKPVRTADPHLALALGDGSLTLERGSIILRATTAVADVPRGVFTVSSVDDKAIALTGGVRLVPAAPRDTGAVPPLTIRISRLDYDAFRPNVRVGLMAYFF